LRIARWIDELSFLKFSASSQISSRELTPITWKVLDGE
jgi:hypothetical protein